MNGKKQLTKQLTKHLTRPRFLVGASSAKGLGGCTKRNSPTQGLFFSLPQGGQHPSPKPLARGVAGLPRAWAPGPRWVVAVSLDALLYLTAAAVLAPAGLVALGAAAAASAPGADAGMAGATSAGATTAGGFTWVALALGAAWGAIGKSGTKSKATMLMILINGLTAGPAVSL